MSIIDRYIFNVVENGSYLVLWAHHEKARYVCRRDGRLFLSILQTKSVSGHHFRILLLYDKKKRIPVVAQAWSVATRLPVRVLPETSMSVSCDCRVLSGRGLVVGLITFPGNSYKVLCVSMSVVVKPR
jgi:hypothetical protein